MLFNSYEYALFLPLVFALYWGIGGQKPILQNGFLLIASYVFYGWWDPRFLILIVISSLIDFYTGLRIHRSETPNERRAFLALSLAVNLGMLCYFKYANFFIENLNDALTTLGFTSHLSSLNLILPVGISFYTFQTMSYTIDVYKRRLEPTTEIFTFLVFVAYFPQLVAGPIERAIHLLPQFKKNRYFNSELASDGMKQILWGLFKKVVVADTCAIYANEIFNSYSQMTTPALLCGALYFSFQIYGDFSGYSDIAIGTSKLFGIDLMLNFKTPYFSRDIAEFWRRWHISLSTWFRDYVYIPLGGSKLGSIKNLRNVIIIFLVSGFWHGANWTFVAWGALNALYFIPLLLMKKHRTHTDTVAQGHSLPTLKEFFQILSTFSLCLLAWIFFRSPTLEDSFRYIQKLIEFNMRVDRMDLFKYLPFIGILVLWEWFTREKEHGLQLKKFPPLFRWATYYGLVWLICRFLFVQKTFIYFQF